jgi:transposase
MSVPFVTIGIDVSDRKSHVCVLDVLGVVKLETTIPTTPEGLAALLEDYRGARVAYEVGCHSPWMTRLTEGLDCEAIVANPRKLSYITKSNKKRGLDGK